MSSTSSWPSTFLVRNVCWSSSFLLSSSLFNDGSNKPNTSHASLCSLPPTVFPQLYLYMISQRKKTFSPPRPTPVIAGIQFPADSKGERSTTTTNQAAFAASLLNVDLPVWFCSFLRD